MSRRIGAYPGNLDEVRQAYERAPIGVRDILRRHPGYAARENLESLGKMVSIFDDSVEEFLSCVRQFHDEAHTNGLLERRRRDDLKLMEMRIRRGLFTILHSVTAIVDSYRTLTREVEIDGYKERIQDEFRSDGPHRFLQSLRNNIGHVRLVDAGWSLSNSIRDGRETRFLLKQSDLLIFSDWNAQAKTYIASHPEGIDVEALLVPYREKVNNLYQWFAASWNKVFEDTIAEYSEFERFINGNDARMIWNMILQQFVIPRALDPYEYLDRYLTEDELEVVKKMPTKTRAQVDSIIEIIDEYESCDDDLRAIVYKVFGVKGYT